VQPPDDVADLIEQPGLAARRCRILMSVHTVFPYWGARHLVQSLSFSTSLPMPPPPYNTAQTRPASTAYGPAAFPGARPGRSRY
jgi:hypothetical protein